MPDLVPTFTIDPANFTRIDAASSPVFSVDGTRLFHLRGAAQSQLWVVDIDGSRARQLAGHDEKVSLLRRAPKDDRLIYSIDSGGDERHQLWLLEDNASYLLIEAVHVIHGMGAWSPDGERISFTANDRDPAHFDVLEFNIDSNYATRLMEGTHEATVGGWSTDGRLIAIQDHNSGDQRPVVIGQGAPAFIPRTAPTRFSALRWDGDALLGLTDAGGSDFMHLARIDPASGAATIEYAVDDRDIEAWALSSTGLLATIENDRGYSILRVGPRGGDRPIVQGLPQGIAADLAWSPDGVTLAFAASAPTHPSSLWLWQNGAARPVWQPACTLKFQDFTLVEWTAHDARPIPGWLALPTGDAPVSGWPAVIWVHGGPAAQARPNFRPDMQSLLSQGYAVLMPNVRGSTGYGRAAMESDDVEKRLDSVHDLAAAHTFLAAQPHIDPARIAVMGQSYGGYMVLAAITEHPNLWRCAIDFYGIADFVTLLDATGPWRKAHRAAEYGDPIRHRALFDRISPIRHIARATMPILVLHGTRDPRVSINESEQLVAAMHGRDVTYETFDYAGHGFVRSEDKVRVYKAVAAFLAKHL